MRIVIKTVFMVLVTLAAGAAVFASGLPAITDLVSAEPTYLQDDGNDQPEVTARVARISYIYGAARIRRSGVDEWENVTLNLPLVAGDEIATDGASKIEIQFDKAQHLRLWENSYLKIVTLADDNIAVSVSIGTAALRITSFDKDRQSFEIDAPKTTVAVQRAGEYRIDAGRDGDKEIRVVAKEGGEARIYSDNSGFTLKNGRSTRIFIEGQNVGEWETGDAARYTDDFDEWSSDRDLTIAKRLRDAYYDKYYDNDIYGADDLNDNGQWVYVSGYGTVWQPHSSSISRYADWSPYRYGHWRWMPPYGWVWVNDEPWGWATYHHGRWFYQNARWYWSPYSYYRPSRSWWFPALVAINIINNNTCWYPLSYRHRWRNYNAGYNGNHNGGPRNIGNTPPRINTDPKDLSSRKEMPLDDEAVPPNAVVAVSSDKFGSRSEAKRPPLDIARTALSKKVTDGNGATLPLYKDVVDRPDRAIRPPVADRIDGTKTGAGIRKDSRPLDDELRTKTVLGGRLPPPDVAKGEDSSDRPKQGAFQRPPVNSDKSDSTRYRPPTPSDPPRDVRPADPKDPRKTPPLERAEPPRDQRPKESATPRYTPPPAKERPAEKPRYEPPTVRPTRSEPPPTKSEPKPPEKKAPPPPEKVDSPKKDKP